MVERSDRDNTRFQLGEIAGIVSTLPERMDRFERSVQEDLSEIKKLLMGQDKRLNLVERFQWRFTRVYAGIWAIIIAGLSGFFTTIWRGH